MLTWLWYTILLASAVVLAIVLFQLREAHKNGTPFVLPDPLNRFLRLFFLFVIFALLISGGFFQDIRAFVSGDLSEILDLEQQESKVATQIAKSEQALGCVIS